MEQMGPREIQAALAMPFAPEDLEWRLQQVNKEKLWGIAVPYVTNRAIQSRLDEVVGPENWRNEYRPWHGTKTKDAQLCGISIWFEGRDWITKWDGAEDSDIEPVKGGLSDSMKRAAVQWGIGRVLYSMDTVFVDVEQKGNSYVIKPSGRAKLDKAYLDTLEKLGLTPAKPGGVQSQLTPRQTGEAEKKQRAKNQSGGKKDQPAPGGKIRRLPVKGQETPPAYEYRVAAAKEQKGMKSTNTMVSLVTSDGEKSVKAFVRGSHPELKPDTLLTNTRLTLKQQDTVKFYVLEEFQVVEQEKAA